MATKKRAVLVVLGAVLATALVSGPARAERMSFDHRLYPALKASLDSGDKDKVLYNDSNPKYVYDLIVVQGTTTSDWSEGLEIITRTPGRGMATARDWLEDMRRRQARGCASTFTVLVEDARSITFERLSPGCPAAAAQTGLYKIMAGTRSLFLLGGLFKGEMSADMRQHWLALLASAQLS